jgi:hypothetical protein
MAAMPIGRAVACGALSLEPGKAPLVAGLGLACVLGAAVLAWFSSPATLQLARDSENRVSAALDSRLFGLITSKAERIEGIRSVSLVRSRAPGSTSHTPDRIIFETTNGSVDLGRNQQLFAVDYPELASFFEEDSPTSLTLSTIARGAELRRFFIAQTIALFMLLGGLGLEWMVVRHVMT